MTDHELALELLGILVDQEQEENNPLTSQESELYMSLVNFLESELIEIPFGVVY